MNSDQLPTPESEETKPVHGEADGAPTATDNQNMPPKEQTSILYRVKWEDARDISRTQEFVSAVPLGPLEVTTKSFDGTTLVENPTSSLPAVEIISTIEGNAPKTLLDGTTVYSSDESESSTRSSPVRSRRRNRAKPPRAVSPGSDTERSDVPNKPKYAPVAFKDITITDVLRTIIRINSEDLLKAIRGIIKYYPPNRFSGDSVEIASPYFFFADHFDELEELQGKLGKDDLTGKHLDALMQYLKQSIGPRLETAKARLSRPVPVVSYDDLWILFKPGLDIYTYVGLSHDSILTAGVVIETENIRVDRSDRREGKKDYFRVNYWGLESNGVRISRDEMWKSIDMYDGERQVLSLPIFPSRYRDSKDGGETRRSLEERGERLYKLIYAQPRQMWYDGHFFSAKKRKYRGTAIIDTSTAIANKDFAEDEDTAYGFFNKELTFHSDNSDMLDYTLETFPYASYHNMTVEDTPELPSKHHYFLVQPIVPGFALNDKTWRLFHIDELTEMKSESNMESLIIDPGNRDIVQAICHAQSHPWKIDSVSSKGEGQVALLHGPPGVGKTYTVECIAQATGRSLIALTIGDLMDDEEKIESKLVNWFSLAERWKAILLLDEADIFLERRATRDIQRNGIVSIFLRRMEYFRGLLFLTTNRVGQIDDAFLSRVTVVLQYDHLTDDTRKKIWNGFFKKLQQESEHRSSSSKGGNNDSSSSDDTRKIEVDRYAQKYVLNDPEVKDLKWNGREIRNALQTAISLANYKAVKEGSTSNVVEIEEEHFRSVVDMSRKFKLYMTSITGKDEFERAGARLERPPPSQSSLT
ncbi:MAG: hypothetical protein Q9195_005268 [Heterodermia aff. obscurata]